MIQIPMTQQFDSGIVTQEKKKTLELMHENIYNSIHMIDPNWKQSKYQLTVDWANKLWYSDLSKYYIFKK